MNKNQLKIKKVINIQKIIFLKKMKNQFQIFLNKYQLKRLEIKKVIKFQKIIFLKKMKNQFPILMNKITGKILELKEIKELIKFQKKRDNNYKKYNKQQRTMIVFSMKAISQKRSKNKILLQKVNRKESKYT